MQTSLKVSRLATGLLSRAVAFNFCVDWAPMDPRKHTTMNHNPHAMYLDLYEYGHYPDWVHICSKAPTSYQPQVLSILATTLSQRYGKQITPDFLLSKGSRSWARLLSKDLKVGEQFHELYPALLGQLASGIFLKESRLTWVLEQKVRHDFTMASFDLSAPETVQDFLDQYNENIEELVLMSNMGFAAEIDQAESALEKHENQQHYNYATGVQELKNLKPEHDNFFNRLLAYFH